MVHTEVLKNKWTALGYALGAPSSKIEKINDKYHDKPLSALVRVYRYWLAEENGFVPTWKKLIDALRLMKEINLCVQITKTLEVSISRCNSLLMSYPLLCSYMYFIGPYYNPDI